MYLSKLQIVGFKSFAQKIEFKFNEGITGLVGPNGCGKTNVVDAIRWVLGEQKTTVLRSDVMENVIFNGSRNRKPLGMAEVSLILENNKKVLPTEYSEVTVTRRLFRNGDSQYLLNNTHCRLRDVLDLFMDTGMGSDSYSVIELKMVEIILSGKPEERRHLFEEAAGVVKYKLRRKEAGKKLLSVQNDLTRVQDIVIEVEKQVNSLSRQAAKTRRYNKLQQQFREMDLTIVQYDFSKIKYGIIGLQRDLTKFKEERTTSEKDYTESESDLFSIEQELSNLNKDYKNVSEKESNLKASFSQKSKEKAVAEEKINSITNTNVRFQNEIEEAKHFLEESQISIEENTLKLKELDVVLDDANVELQSKRFLVNEAHQAANNLKSEANDINSEVVGVQSRINQIKSENKKNLVRKESVAKNLKQSEIQIQNIYNDINGIEDNIAKSNALKNSLDLELKKAHTLLTTATNDKNEFEEKINEINLTINKKRNELNSKKSSLDFEKSVVVADESTKYLLNENTWLANQEKSLLAETIGADDLYRVAIDSALGEAAHYFIVNSEEDALAGIKFLKEKNKGKATFICRDKVPNIPSPKILPPIDGVIGLISEIVRVDDHIRNILRALTGHTVIVENSEIAKELINNCEVDCAVTLEGELFKSSGIIRSGSLLKMEGMAVGKKERIEALKSAILGLSSEIENLDIEFKKNKSKLESINFKKLNEELKSAEANNYQNEQRIVKLTYQKESLHSTLDVHHQNIKRFQDEIANIEDEDKVLVDELLDLEEQFLVVRTNLQDKMQQVSEAENNLSELEESARSTELSKIKIDAEINSVKKEIERLTKEKVFLANKIQNFEQELIQNKKTVEELTNNIKIYSIELEKINLELIELLNEKEFLSQKISGLEEKASQYSNLLVQKRKLNEKAIESIHQTDLKLNELSIKSNNLTAHIKEQYDLNLDELEYTPIENFSIQEAQVVLTDLKEKLSSLGNVNFMALEEFEEQNQRLNFYQAQVKDLVDSEKTLQETISEINRTAEEKFIKTFNQVNENFKDLFLKLFGEDAQAELKLADGNPLECDIEIIAKPPGKRPHSIETLSGGEKTLTAIALLFGIYLVKPSPFCILDEVDAPLDDANIDKFLSLIKEFSNNTQFLVVTHNKRTMESSDTLYGITMEEEGVSKVVSVKLSQGIF